MEIRDWQSSSKLNCAILRKKTSIFQENILCVYGVQFTSFHVFRENERGYGVALCLSEIDIFCLHLWPKIVTIFENLGTGVVRTPYQNTHRFCDLPTSILFISKLLSRFLWEKKRSFFYYKFSGILPFFHRYFDMFSIGEYDVVHIYGFRSILKGYCTLLLMKEPSPFLFASGHFN